MSILAPYPVLTSPALPVEQYQDSRTLAFEALDGTGIFGSTGQEFFWLQGIDGLEIPPREIITKPIPGMDGAKIQKIRTGVREIFLPMFLEDMSSHRAYLDDTDALAALFDYRRVDYRALDGTLNLVANSIRGTRRLRCTYSSGADTGYGTDNEGSTWASMGLKFLCVQPYWYGEEWSTPIIRQPVAIDTFASFPLEFSSDVVLGADIPITIGGQVDSRITVDLVGPASAVTVTGEGLLFSIPGGLLDGETAKIITDPRNRRALFGGATDWSRVGPATTWQPLKPGDQLLTISMTGTTSATSARVSGASLYERPW